MPRPNPRAVKPQGTQLRTHRLGRGAGLCLSGSGSRLVPLPCQHRRRRRRRRGGRVRFFQPQRHGHKLPLRSALLLAAAEQLLLQLVRLRAALVERSVCCVQLLLGGLCLALLHRLSRTHEKVYRWMCWHVISGTFLNDSSLTSAATSSASL